jgi:hypothetical protein
MAVRVLAGRSDPLLDDATTLIRQTSRGYPRAVVVVVAVVTVLVLATTGGNQTDDQFDKAAKAFHGQRNPAARQLATDLASASGGFGDASFLAARQDARSSPMRTTRTAPHSTRSPFPRRPRPQRRNW